MDAKGDDRARPDWESLTQKLVELNKWVKAEPLGRDPDFLIVTWLIRQARNLSEDKVRDDAQLARRAERIERGMQEVEAQKVTGEAGKPES